MGLLLLVRHAQASFGADDYDVLSEPGWEQARTLGRWLREAGTTPSALVRGSMRRHRETLEAMTDGAGWPLSEVEVDGGWDEFDHLGLVGSLPDLPDATVDRREFQRHFERATQAWIAGTHGDGVESWPDFLARTRAAFARATEAAGSGKTVVVVTSGGPIGACCAGLVDPDGGDPVTARLWQRFNAVVVNAAVTRVVVGSTGARLLTFNEHPHLTGDLLTYR